VPCLKTENEDIIFLQNCGNHTKITLDHNSQKTKDRTFDITETWNWSSPVLLRCVR